MSILKQMKLTKLHLTHEGLNTSLVTKFNLYYIWVLHPQPLVWVKNKDEVIGSYFLTSLTTRLSCQHFRFCQIILNGNVTIFAADRTKTTAKSPFPIIKLNDTTWTQ